MNNNNHKFLKILRNSIPANITKLNKHKHFILNRIPITLKNKIIIIMIKINHKIIEKDLHYHNIINKKKTINIAIMIIIDNKIMEIKINSTKITLSL